MVEALEQNQRLPDPITLAALFVPALGLERDQGMAARLLDLAAAADDPPPPTTLPQMLLLAR